MAMFQCFATFLIFLVGSAAALSCNMHEFAALLPSNATVTRISTVTAGSGFGQPPAENPEFPAPAGGLPELCAVDVKVQSSPNSSFHFGLFLPTQQAWNKRFLMTGNGGFGGGINVSGSFD